MKLFYNRDVIVQAIEDDAEKEDFLTNIQALVEDKKLFYEILTQLQANVKKLKIREKNKTSFEVAKSFEVIFANLLNKEINKKKVFLDILDEQSVSIIHKDNKKKVYATLQRYIKNFTYRK